MPASDLATALADAGGAGAPREQHARLRALLVAELDRGARELTLARAGREDPVLAAFAADPAEGVLLGVVPVDPALRVDPAATSERGWLIAAAVVGALADGGGDVVHLTAGAIGAHLALRAPARAPDADLAALAFASDHAQAIDRVRIVAVTVPVGVVPAARDGGLPQGPTHPLRIAAQVAIRGGRPADPASVAAFEEDILAALTGAAASTPRPHDDPDPARRVARRILQRLDGMGKWGGYHTNVAHLARGFAGNDRALADRVGEALLAAGLLRAKVSVGQRHVFLNPARAAAIRAAIDEGALPEDLTLPPAG